MMKTKNRKFLALRVTVTLKENVFAPIVFELKLDTQYSITAAVSDLLANCFRTFLRQCK